MAEQKEPFDPFDERNREKRKRRKKSEIEFEKKQWTQRIDNHFVRALESENWSVKWPDYVQSNVILMTIMMTEETNIKELTIRRNTEAAMNRLGYVKIINPKTKDGRWTRNRESFFVYGKKDKTDINKQELKKYFSW